MFRKIGENISFKPDSIMTASEALADDKIAKRFVKFAKKLKRIAPRAKDFTYAHAIIMHSSEAALINQDTGEPIMNNDGNPVTGAFEEITLKNGTKSIKWVSVDGIKPYANLNRDIFPESELIKSHSGFQGRPLCINHESDSVDGIRGIIIDTIYDKKYKRVHALFALDKKNYPDLARKVETGYSSNVSMGTGVGRSICTECGSVAQTERDYCRHVKDRTNYGEINMDLSPIELSLVVSGADSLAKVKNIIASIQNYADTKQERVDELLIGACVNPNELISLADNIKEMQTKLNALLTIDKKQKPKKKVEAFDADTAKSITGLMKQIQQYEGTPDADPEVLAGLMTVLKDMLGQSKDSKPSEAPEASPMTGGGSEPSASPMAGGEAGPHRTTTTPIALEPSHRLASVEKERDGSLGDVSKELRLLRSKISTLNKSFNELKMVSKEDDNMNSARLRARAKARRNAYWLGGGGVNEPTPGKPKYDKEEADKIRDTEDKQMTGVIETGKEGLHPGDKEIKEKLLRAEELANRKLKRQALLNDVSGDGDKLSEAKLEERRLKRRAYMQGGGGINEPTPGKPKYDKEEADKIRDTEDKHMTGLTDLGGTSGMVPGDEALKKKLLRARLRAKFTKVADTKGEIVKSASRWDIFAGEKLILSATAGEIFGDELSGNWDYISSKDYGKEVISQIRSEGFDRVAYLLKGAADPLAEMAAPEMDMGALPAAEAPAAPAAEEAPKEDEDDLQGKVNAALTKIETALEDVRSAVSEGGEKLVDIEVKVDEGGDDKEAPAPMDQALAADDSEALEVQSLLDESADELAMVSEALDGVADLDDAVRSKLETAASQAVADSETLLAQASVIVEAKAKKCKDCDMLSQFCKCDKKDKKDDDDKDDKDDKKDDKEKKDDKDDKKDDKEKKASKLLEAALKVRAQNRAELLAKAMGGEMEMDYDLDAETEGALKQLLDEEKAETSPEGGLMHPDLADAPDEACALDHEHSDACDGAMMADDGDAALDELESLDSVMAARKSERDSLIAQAESILGKYELTLDKAQNATEPTYFQAHPGGKGTVTDLTHTKTDGAKVETLSEIHDVMRDVAESGPRNVREAAEAIQAGIVKGAFTSSDLDTLVSEGKVDAAAAAFWKKYWAQGSDTGSFGADLSKEFATKKKEAGNGEFKTKLRRAYAVGLEAQDKGLIASTKASLETYVDQMMSFDDQAFESNKRVIANYSSAKTSGSLPRVGVDAGNEAMTVTASPEPVQAVGINTQLANLNWR